ncbi:putative gluconokinase, partial [Pseudolycoriella hygida]
MNMCESGIALIVMGPSACEKMSNGIPLTDDDRFPWLKTVRQHLVEAYQQSVVNDSDSNLTKVRVVVACSALKKIYRDILRGSYAGLEDALGLKLKTNFVFLNCSERVLIERIGSREGHFMKPNMLQSQLNALQKPDVDEGAITVNGDESLSTIIAEVAKCLTEWYTI